jgi:hypothetical protein
MAATPRVLYAAFLAAIAALPSLCQSVSFGVVGGVPLVDALNNGGASASVGTRRWTAGPTVEFPLPAGFVAGVDALYRFYDIALPVIEYDSVRNWSVPVYLKHRVPRAPLHLFVAAGAVAGHFATNDSLTTRLISCGLVCTITSTLTVTRSSAWAGGAMLATGIELHAGWLKIAPELRYTRWANGPFSSTGGFLASGAALSNPNQFELLVSLRH